VPFGLSGHTLTIVVGLLRSESVAPVHEPTDPADPTVAGAVPFNRPGIQGRELELMRLAVEHGHTSAAGPYSSGASEVLRAEIGAHDVLLTTSCTAALEMAAMLLDIGPGDSIVVPSFAYVTTALAFVRQGAVVRFCDIEPRRLGLDPDDLAGVMDSSVRAVVPIHYAGVACDVDRIQAVLDDWPRAALVEDVAHGLFGRSRGRPLGSLGRFAALSFHETKNIMCGEGGALVVNRPDDANRAEVLYHKGTDRGSFLRGEVDKYTWRDLGSSFGLSDILAAYLYGQLEQRDLILSKRARAFDRYVELLAPEADRLGLRLPEVPDDCEQAYHMFYVLLPDGERRDHALDAMRERGVHATFHYVPLHSSPAGRRFAASPAACPVTDDVSARLLRLPFFTDIDDGEIERAAGTLVDVLS
jgi:dTDP-4-amino-4,6-dideoxygalactose transaminase